MSNKVNRTRKKNSLKKNLLLTTICVVYLALMVASLRWIDSKDNERSTSNTYHVAMKYMVASNPVEYNYCLTDREGDLTTEQMVKFVEADITKSKYGAKASKQPPASISITYPCPINVEDDVNLTKLVSGDSNILYDLFKLT